MGGAAKLSQSDVAAALGEGLNALDCHLLVLVDGHFAANLSQIDAIDAECELGNLAQALEAPPDWLRQALALGDGAQDNTILSLNTALMSDGVVLRLNDGARLEKPVHIVHVQGAGQAASAFARNVVSLGKGAEASLIESFVKVSDAPFQRVAASDIALADEARLQHVKLQTEGLAATHLSAWRTKLGAGADYNAFQFAEGSELARSEIHLNFAGERATASVNGVFLGRDDQHLDTTLFVDHAVPHCQSRMLFKGVLDDAARGVFQGKIMGAPAGPKDRQQGDGPRTAALRAGGVRFQAGARDLRR